MPLSYCGTCGVAPIDARTPSSVRRGKCVACHRAYMRAYMRDYRRRGVAEGRGPSERLALRRALAEVMGGACQRCGWRPEAWAEWSRLHFHHRDPTAKRFTVATRLATASVEALRAEVATCDLLCESCHRVTHGGIPMQALALAALGDGAARTVAELAERIASDPEAVGRSVTRVGASLRVTLDRLSRAGTVTKVGPGRYRISHDP